MQKQRIDKVIIAGGGIAGPVLGLFLRRLGVHVVIAEARPALLASEGAFLGLAPNGMNVLAELGLAEKVAMLGHACNSFAFVNGEGRGIGEIDRRADKRQFGWALTMVRRGQLHALLATEAARAGVEIRYGARVVGVEHEEDGRVVARLAGAEGLAGDLLVGADGLRSAVRQLALPNAPAPVYDGLFDCGGFAPAGASALPFGSGVNQMLFGRRAFFGAFTTPLGETWWFANGPAKEADAVDAAGLRARLSQLFAADPSWVQALIDATPELLGPWPLYDLEGMKTWSADRVVLIGDAAHAMSPSAGQGASLAIEDSLVLAQSLRDTAPEAGLSAALAAYERRRRPRVDAIFRQARRNSQRKAVEGRLALWLRDRMMPMFLKLGAKQHSKAYAYRLSW